MARSAAVSALPAAGADHEDGTAAGQGVCGSNQDPEQRCQNGQQVRSGTGRLWDWHHDQAATVTGGNSSSGSSSVWELVGTVALTSNLDRLKWYRTSLWTVKFFAVLNVTYTVVGLSSLLISIFSTQDSLMGLHQKSQFFRLGILISVFSPLTLCADLLALMGLRSWRKRLLIPWLIVYACAVLLSFGVTAIDLHQNGLRWPVLVLGFCCLVVLSRWRHMSTQYKLMSVYPEAPTSESDMSDGADLVVTTVAAATLQRMSACGPRTRVLMHPRSAGVVLATATTVAPQTLSDVSPPPKYEDLDQPPKYEDSFDPVVDNLPVRPSNTQAWNNVAEVPAGAGRPWPPTFNSVDVQGNH